MSSFFSNKVDDDYENIPLLNDDVELRHQRRSNNNNNNNNNNNATRRFHPLLLTLLFVVAIIAIINTVSTSPSSNEHPIVNDHSHNNNLHQNNVTITPTDIAANTNATIKDASLVGQEIPPDELKALLDEQVQEMTPSLDDNQEEEEDQEEEEESTTDDEESNKEVVEGASIATLRNKNDNKKKQQGGDKDDDKKDGKKSGGGKGKGKGRRGGGGGKKKATPRAKYDLSALHKAIKNSDSNPFNVDYHSIIQKLAKDHPEISGDLDLGKNYNMRQFRTHLGHEMSDGKEDFEWEHALRFFHISDPHIDPFFNPMTTSQQGVCSSCKMNSKVYGDAAFCPLSTPYGNNDKNDQLGYKFGRLRCNPPSALLASLLAFLRHHQREPAFFLISGDAGAHGLATDTKPILPDTKLQDFCPTKFLGMRETFKTIRELFPSTPLLFSAGNNDHLAKNVVWTPYFEALAVLLVEFNMLHPSQAQTFSRIGSHYVDLEVDNEAYKNFVLSAVQNKTHIKGKDAKNSKDGVELKKKEIERLKAGFKTINPTTNIRILLPDMTLLAPGGEASFVPEERYEHLEGLERENVQYPKRAELLAWFNATLFDAQKNNRVVYIGGHQPMTTKKGQNELMLTTSTHGLLLKALLQQYQSIIKAGFFGHRNLASISNILGPTGTDQLIPQVVVPGVSPRGLNLPAVQEVSLSRNTGTVLDFEQFVFDLLEENERAQLLARNPNMFVEQAKSGNGQTQDIAADSGRAIIHEVMNSRLEDKYDPKSYQTHLQSVEHQNEQARVGALNDKVLRYGLDCGDDAELCAFVEKWGYLGYWINNNEVSSWRKMTGYSELTAQTVSLMNARVPTSARLFTALQIFKRGGLIGDQTPENIYCNASHDDEDAITRCLFPENDPLEGCFAKTWLK